MTNKKRESSHLMYRKRQKIRQTYVMMKIGRCLKFHTFISPSKASTNSNGICFICGKFGKDKELWYRRVVCASWNHTECAEENTPGNYIFDFAYISDFFVIEIKLLPYE